MELAEKIKLTLQEKLCPIHDVHPVVEITGGEINIACCCIYFQNFCRIEAEYLRSKFADKLAADNFIHVG